MKTRLSSPKISWNLKQYHDSTKSPTKTRLLSLKILESLNRMMSLKLLWTMNLKPFLYEKTTTKMILSSSNLRRQSLRAPILYKTGY